MDVSLNGGTPKSIQIIHFNGVFRGFPFSTIHFGGPPLLLETAICFNEAKWGGSTTIPFSMDDHPNNRTWIRGFITKKCLGFFLPQTACSLVPPFLQKTPLTSWRDLIPPSWPSKNPPSPGGNPNESQSPEVRSLRFVDHRPPLVVFQRSVLLSEVVGFGAVLWHGHCCCWGFFGLFWDVVWIGFPERYCVFFKEDSSSNEICSLKNVTWGGFVSWSYECSQNENEKNILKSPKRWSGKNDSFLFDCLFSPKNRKVFVQKGGTCTQLKQPKV